MHLIDASQVHANLTFNQLIPLLKSSFSGDFSMPQRNVYHLYPDKSHDALALLPAWNEDFIGCKLFTYFPQNAKEHDLPSLFSKIVLFRQNTGEPIALVDGTSVTYWRTAAVSALASQLLSRENSTHFLLFGTGNLSRYLLNAHLSVRDIKCVKIWGRSKIKMQNLVDEYQNLHPTIRFEPCLEVDNAVSEADIICCATASKTPLFNGSMVKEGCHIDCLGNHDKNARECDSSLVTRARVYVDSLANTLNEAGELLIPIEEGVFNADNIVSELADMCRQPTMLRQNESEITLFKSVGTAISDLVTASHVYNKVYTE